MVEILEKVSRGNLQEVKDSYGKDFPKYMKKFNELGISPITIEKRSPFSELENPLYYIEYKNKNFRWVREISVKWSRYILRQIVCWQGIPFEPMKNLRNVYIL